MLSNLSTTLGVLLVLVAVAMLTGNVWWAVLLAGVVFLAAGWVSRPIEQAAPVVKARLRAVPNDEAKAAA